MRNEKVSKLQNISTLVDHDMKIWSQECTFIISTILVLVFILYQTKTLKSIPCDKGILNGFLRSFIHITTKHLLANLAGIYILYRAEVQLGSERFLRVFISILTMSVVFESIYETASKTESCSIGFSGVLFGFAAWSILTESKIDCSLMGALLVFMIMSSLNDPRVSLSGHFSGFLAGVITALYMGTIEKRTVHKLASF